MLGLSRDNGQENGSDYTILGYTYWGYSREEGNMLHRDSVGIIFPYSVLATRKLITVSVWLAGG